METVALKIIYSSEKTKLICTDIRNAKRFFGGQEKYAISLLSRINALANAEHLKDIIIQPQMRFHKLVNKGKQSNLLGFFAIDVKTKNDSWRIVLKPLDENEKEFVPCNIDEIASIVKTIEIKEVSNHYE